MVYDLVTKQAFDIHDHDPHLPQHGHHDGGDGRQSQLKVDILYNINMVFIIIFMGSACSRCWPCASTTSASAGIS